MGKILSGVTMPRLWFAIGAVYAFLAVAFGAFGAHVLEASMDAYAKSVYSKAVLYQMIHSGGLFVVGFLQVVNPKFKIDISGWAFLLGIILFSGSLYLIAITGVRAFGAVAPFGGTAFLVGWGNLAYRITRMK